MEKREVAYAKTGRNPARIPIFQTPTQAVELASNIKDNGARAKTLSTWALLSSVLIKGLPPL